MTMTKKIPEDRGVNDFIRVANKAIKETNNDPDIVALAIESATSMIGKAKEGIAVLSTTEKGKEGIAALNEDVEKLEDYISKLNKIKGVKS